uniref:Uncharacterized protein n=1 Tax=Synechococcus sp. PCC 9341 TaxID=2099386 RepID=A0A2P0ZGE8_9SYNE|nr:hypothetical protein [Synechococcus sp. PCC 9341]
MANISISNLNPDSENYLEELCSEAEINQIVGEGNLGVFLAGVGVGGLAGGLIGFGAGVALAYYIYYK